MASRIQSKPLASRIQSRPLASRLQLKAKAPEVEEERSKKPVVERKVCISQYMDHCGHLNL